MRLQTSALVDIMAGSLNGSSVRRSRYGLVLQAKAQMPSGIKPKVATARQWFGIYAANWRNLDPGYQAEWAIIAENNPVVDKFGNEIKLSGYAYYMKIQSAIPASLTGIISPFDYDLVPTSITTQTVIDDTSELRFSNIIANNSGDYYLHAGLVAAYNSNVTPFAKNAKSNKVIRFSGDTGEIAWRLNDIDLSKDSGLWIVYKITHKFGWVSPISALFYRVS